MIKGEHMKAILVLEDGSSFEGLSLGTAGEAVGEVVLNTAVVGYQEMVTDPANAGRILILTYPLIGNYGVAKKFGESEKCRVAALVIKELSRTYSNWQAEGSFEDFLKKEGTPALSDIDTRTIAVTIRDKGEMMGIVSTGSTSKEELLKKLASHKNSKIGLIKELSTKSPYEIKGGHNGARMAVLDLGVTNSLLKQLTGMGCAITVLPYNTTPKEILSKKYDGLIVSGGPENDASLGDVSGTVKEILGKVPIMGIATGHQVIALALGARLKKMKIGHHGVNYPIKWKDGFKGEVTVQNHSYVIDEDSIKSAKSVNISARNINDDTIEELESRPLRFISTQYVPASPGFDEINQAMLRFMKIVGKSPKANIPVKASSEVQYAKA
jgi:carbamoyl-phosphate synthase small subunit